MNYFQELQTAQELLQQKFSEQLYTIETMRNRLEQQKQNAPFAHKQALSQLELQLHEAGVQYNSLEQMVAEKDIEVIHLLFFFFSLILVLFVCTIQ